MALSQRFRDTAYLAIIGTQLFGMLVLDLVAFYPKALWEAPSAPLHFLTTLRENYVAITGDPFFASPSHEPWFDVFLFLEGTLQLPMSAYLVWKLATRSSTEGATELVAMVFGTVVATTSITCCYHLWTLGEDVVRPEQKAMVLYGEYLPFSIIPVVMVLDMYQRLLSRVDHSPKPKTQ